MRNAALSLFALLVCSSVFAAGHEITTPQFVASPLYPMLPAVATNGTSFMSLWKLGDRLYGSIAATDGTVITTVPFRVSVSADSFGVVGTGPGYLLYWTQGGQTYIGDLANDGSVTNIRGPIAVAPLVVQSIAVNGSEVCVAGSTTDGIAVGAAHILRLDGTVIAKSIPISTTWGLRDVTNAGNDFVITDTENAGIFVYRFNASGNSVWPARLVVPAATPGHGVAAAASGDDIVLVWTDANVLWSAHISADGGIQQRSVLLASHFVSDCSVVWDGREYVATAIVSDSTTPPHTLALHLDRAGSPLDSPVEVGGVVQHSVSAPTVTFGVGVDPFSRTLIATSFETDPTIHDPHNVVLSLSLASQSAPALASDGVNFMTVFNERTASTSSIKVAAFDPSGNAMSGAGLPLATGDQLSNAAIAHGSVDLVVWASRSGIVARRIAHDGTVLDTEPIPIGNGSGRPDVAWNGTSFLVVWAGQGISGAIVRPDGSVTPPQVIAVAGNIDPRVAWNGQLFLVVYEIAQGCSFECVGSPGPVFAIRVAADGTPLDGAGTSVDDDPVHSAPATVASNGNEFVVALAGEHSVSMKRVRSAGMSILVSDARILFDWFAPTMAGIAWNGSEYIVTWEYKGADRSWLATARLQSVDDAPAMSAIEFGGSDSAPAIASNQIGVTAVAVAEEIDNPDLPRVRAYLDSEFQPMPPPPAAPMNVAVIGNKPNLVISWKADADAAGIAVDLVRSDGTRTPIIAVLSANQSTMPITVDGNVSFEVRAFNAGGLSDPVFVSAVTPPRRRATR